MDLQKLDAELNVKIIESLKETLKKKNVKIIFDIPINDILEASTIQLDKNNFKLIKKELYEEIKDLNPRYLKFIRKKLLNNTRELNQPQAIDYVIKKTKHLFFLKPFLGNKIKKTFISHIVYRINYNNIIIELDKQDYDRLNYYTKYVYKLQQLYKLNFILGINQTFNVVFDDDKIAMDLYKNMYDNLGDILKPPNKK
jgi:hypothetical protein